MKKLFCLYSLLCSVAVFAQSIATKDLLGTWKVDYITTPDLTVDMKNMEVTLFPETIEWAKKKNRSTDALKKDALKNAEAYVNVTYSFSPKGAYTEQRPGSKPVTAEYELTSSGGQNVIYVYYDEEDSEDMYYVSYENEHLYLEYDEVEVTLICRKIK